MKDLAIPGIAGATGRPVAASQTLCDAVHARRQHATAIRAKLRRNNGGLMRELRQRGVCAAHVPHPHDRVCLLPGGNKSKAIGAER
ncbi:MAG: hypothetical protein L0Z50_13210 [Verrucomicrobiales bacterium]|nr:hypothetical protein [Verrucomicrobiales bacterium]